VLSHLVGSNKQQQLSPPGRLVGSLLLDAVQKVISAQQQNDVAIRTEVGYRLRSAQLPKRMNSSRRAQSLAMSRESIPTHPPWNERAKARMRVESRDPPG